MSGPSSSERRVALKATRACAGEALRVILAGPIGWCLAALVIGPFALTTIETGVAEPLVVAVAATGLVMWALLSYVAEALQNDAIPDPAASENLAALLSADLVRRLARKNAVTPGSLLEAAVMSRRGAFILAEIGVPPAKFIFDCASHVEQGLNVAGFLEQAAKEAEHMGEARIDANVILALLIKNVPECRQSLYAADLSEEDLDRIVAWEQLRERILRMERWWRPRQLERTMGSIGRSWVMGYTDALDRLTEDIGLTLPLAGERGVVIHQQELERIAQVLHRDHHRNALVLGKPKTGKMTLVENLAVRLRDEERAGHAAYTRVLKLRTEQLLAGTAASDKALLEAFGRAEARGHFLLVIPNLTVLLKAKDERMMSVLRRFLESRTISVIAIATPEEYHAYCKRDPSLDTLFEKVTVEDASLDETTAVLMAHALRLHKRHRGSVTYKALLSTARLTREYMSNAGFPGVAVDVLDDAIALARNSDGVVTDAHVRDVISVKAKVDVRPAGAGEKDKLLKLEEAMNARVIGQGAAVKVLVAALKRSKLDLRERTRPIGTFLFLGPTGVGKTQTTKALAEQMFGDSDRMIRLDMNEYSHPDAVFGITGKQTDDGFQESELVKRIQDQPFAVVLLDEVEKAHPTVLNVFLQILDEGVLTDAAGRKVDFRSTIIIATSNAGALFIRDWWTSKPEGDVDAFRKQLIDHVLQQRIFTPEFVNRFDAVVAFRPLDKIGAAAVAKLMLADIAADVRLRRGITVKVDDDVLTALVEHGHSVEFGARELRRTVTDLVENRIADVLLDGKTKRGDTVVIRKEDVKM